LPFQLLGDINGGVRKKYSVSKIMGLILGRVTYIISKKEIILHLLIYNLILKNAIEVIKYY